MPTGSRTSRTPSATARRVDTACPLDCPDGCSLEVTVDGGRLVSVEAGQGNALTAGFICQKVGRHPQRVYAPERVLTPLIRTGPKGDGAFRPASWDEAIDVVADRLVAAADCYGPQSVVPYLYNSSAGVLGSESLGPRLWRRFGASRVDHTICAATASAAYELTYGDMLSAEPFDVIHAALVVVWGANPAISNIHLPPLIHAAQEAGARLVVVDPRRTPMAKRADVHLAVLPGTDVVLALAVARHLATNDLLDRAFIAANVDGLDEYLAGAEQWTLARAAATCGVEAGAIAELAELYATTRPAFLRVGWGLERNRNGGSAVRAVLALPLLTGQFGRHGAGVMASLSGATPLHFDPRDPDEARDRPRPRRVNMNLLGAMLTDADLDPPIAVLFVQGANPAAMNPNQGAVLQGLARDDLFTVVHEQVMTDTASFADVVLPATTHFEATDLASSYGSYTMQGFSAVIDRVGESRTNDEVSAAIANRLGYPAESFDPDPDRLLRAAVTDGGSILGVRTLREAGATVQFVDTWPSHPGQRARLHHPGLDTPPVPRFAPLEGDPEQGDDAGQGLLTLISPATHRTINSIFGESRHAAVTVAVSPADAAALGITEGAMVRVSNHRAALVLPARIDVDLRAGVASMPKGVWRREIPGGLTANALTPDSLSDLAGGACFNDTVVRVEPV